MKINIDRINIALSNKEIPIWKMFETVNLSELNKLTPVQRYDSKYICNKSDLNIILRQLSDSYNILQIDDNHIFNYSNVYYDTPDNIFFKNHINGKLGRYKLRKRLYRESCDVFLEIKYKDNHGVTSKHRFRSSIENLHPLEEYQSEISKFFPDTFNKLKPCLNVDYKRITLIKPNVFDKITIDFDLTYTNMDGELVSLPDLLILEHKSINKSNDLFINRNLKFVNYKKMSLSKYCLGQILTKPGIKYNLYKQKLITINKICNGINSKYSQFLWNNTISSVSG